jgi:putative nucleotidyltransferase with HDIG domain
MAGKRHSGKKEPEIAPALRWWRLVRLWLIATLVVLALTLTLIFDILPVSQITLEWGDRAPEDILAPRSITYISEVLTERARQEAVANVRDVYDPPDMRVARAQVSKTRQILDFVETVRADSLAGRTRQKTYINAVPELALDDEVLGGLLDLTGSQWELVRQETLTVVDEAMRNQIRQDRLEEARTAIPLLVPLGLPETEAKVVTALAQHLIVPNSTLNLQLTEQYRQAARENVQPVQQSFDLNSTIVREGEVVTEADLEAMQQFGLLQSETDWIDSARYLVVVLLLVTLLGIYIQRFYPSYLANARYLSLLAVLLVFFTVLAKLTVPGRAILPFLFPSAGLAMLLTVIFDANLAIGMVIAVAAVVGYIGGNSLELAVYAAAGAIIAALVVRKSPRISTFFRTGVVVGLVNTVVVLMYRVDNTDLLGILQLVGASFLNGLLSAGLTLTGFYMVGNVFRMLTTLQLQELARLDHPLLQELLSQAPGTYHHSLMVANLAEQAARRISADADLVRVGSFYHDVGKITRPYFFTENQDGSNAHARLDPTTSAQTIANHVRDGLDLARRYGLPERIRAFIPEHQGTRTIKFFYHLALKKAADPSEVNEDDFRYPGPRPQSKETGIVLLADSCEAASTALQSRNEQEIEELVNQIVNQIAMEGELDESGLTMGEIHLIKESFVDTLQGRFHVRPKYPGQRTSDKLEPIAAPKPLPATQPAGSSQTAEPSKPPEEAEPAPPATAAEIPAVEGGADDV